jgi:CRP-like cAMP-binding protein
MIAPQQASMENKLLAMLPAADYGVVAPHLEHCDLPKGTRLADVGEPVAHIYFLSSGVGSVIVVTRENHRAEAGLFGFEGYVPSHAAAGSSVSPHEVTVQVSGHGFRIEFDAFLSLMETNKSFRTVVLRSVAAFGVQLSFTGASNSLHEVPERLARWLLMCHDRATGDEIPLTHDFMSIMLAVRRPSVTTALHVLEGSRFIKAERGLVIMRDRAALEEFAHDAYGQAEEEYGRLMTRLFE